MNCKKCEVNSVQCEFYDWYQDTPNTITVTEWWNGEGFDIFVQGHDGSRGISLSRGECAGLRAALAMTDLPKEDD